MRRQSRTAFFVALVLLLFGIALPPSYARWLHSRSFLALELPLSLSPGKVSSPDFKINLSGWYQIGVDVDQSFPFRFDCGFGGNPPLLRTDITIYQDGHVVERSGGADRFLGHFHGKSGKVYRFDLDVLTNASCLNAGHPKIFVWTESHDYEYLKDLIWAASAIFFLAGLGTLSFAVAGPVFDPAQPHSGGDVSSGTRPTDALLSRRRLKPRFTHIPHFGLLFSITLGGVLLPAFLVSWEYGYHSEGIRVQLIMPARLRSPEPRAPSLILHVECIKFNAPSRLLLNSKAVRPNALPDSLRSEFKTRSDWVVYVDGDPDCNWDDVANAIDIVRTAGGKVVLMTANHPS